MVFAGAIAYWVSLAAQLAWDVTGAISEKRLSDEVKLDASSSLPVFRSCLTSLKHASMPKECQTVMQSYAGFALMLGALAVWWNPKLSYKAEGRPGRLTGLREYYRIQIVVLVTRFAVWAFLQDDMIMDLNPSLGPIVHVFVGLFTVIVSSVQQLCVSHLGFNV